MQSERQGDQPWQTANNKQDETNTIRMESSIFLGIVLFLLVLAVFDLVVGVSNDAVNFLTSAIGAKVASYRTIIAIAAVGILAGASMSTGMMDVARHGILTPMHYSYYDVMCVFVAVMLTDIILLDIFNTLGMPTSTTVSMVFELLGGAFAVSLLKILQGATAADGTLLSLSDLLNTSKALTCIIGIFLSVAIAFFFGTVVMWLSRLVFTFKYNRAIWWVSKIIVLMGTGLLAFSFASNDLVNFLGVPLAGLDAYNDFATNGNGVATEFKMTSLMESAQTPGAYLVGAGVIMVLALVFSKKSQNVVKTSVDLSRRDEGDEMFGSSGTARVLVRAALRCGNYVVALLPKRFTSWIDTRFENDGADTTGAAFDHIRAAINLLLAGALITLGTKMKLPLSTTYVTFMVAMGTSLADRAWSRESAVFRITGVLSVIGGWLITAGAAFTVCYVMTNILHFGGIAAMVVCIGLALTLLLRGNIKLKKESPVADDDSKFKQLMATSDKAEKWILLKEYMDSCTCAHLRYASASYQKLTDAFFHEEYRPLRKATGEIEEARKLLKRQRRKQIIGLRHIDAFLAVERNTWYYIASNAVEQTLYCLKHINDPAKEHVGNNFSPVAPELAFAFKGFVRELGGIFNQTIACIEQKNYKATDDIRQQAAHLQARLSNYRKEVIDLMQQQTVNIESATVFLNLVQESQQMAGNLRHLLRGMSKFEE